jgi:hypothetical protein
MKPVALFGSEIWTLTKINEDKLKIFERKIQRNIHGSSYVNREYLIKCNELYQLLK